MMGQLMQHFVQTQQQDWGMGCMNGKGMGAMQNLREMLCTESTARVRWLEWRWEELVGGVGGWGSGGAGGENAPRVETATPLPPAASAGAVFDVAENVSNVSTLAGQMNKLYTGSKHENPRYSSRPRSGGR